MHLKLNFDQYVPVQHQPSAAYFAFLAGENKDFDASGDADMYRCYPVRKNGTLNAKVSRSIPKKDLTPILLLL